MTKSTPNNQSPKASARKVAVRKTSTRRTTLPPLKAPNVSAGAKAAAKSLAALQAPKSQAPKAKPKTTAKKVMSKRPTKPSTFKKPSKVNRVSQKANAARTAKPLAAKPKAPAKTKAAKTPPVVKKPVVKKKVIAKKATVQKAVAKKTVAPKTVAKKIAPVKTVAKKAAVKKTVVKKTVVTKPVAKKTAAKKPVVKTTKPLVKTTMAKKPPVKTVSKSTKQDLRTTITNIDARMKRANTLTLKSVKALESAVQTLDARTRKDSSTSKAALTRKVNQLSAKLTDMVAKTQADVNSDLKTALHNPSVENLQAALKKADHRLTEAEQAQAAAISKVNHHLSAIATAVDDRIENEAKARQAAIAALQAQTQNNQAELTARIDTIEEDTAHALSQVGDKIADLSSELTRRGDSSELSIREKVSEIALQTQTEFETYRAGLERRIDNVTQNSDASDTQRLEHSIAALTARLEGLEYAVANPPSIGAPQHVAPPVQTMPSPPRLSVVPSQPDPSPTATLAAAPLMASPQAASHKQLLPDAFSPLANLSETPAAVMPNPYLSAHAEPEPVIVENKDGHHPVEFDPRNFVTKQDPVSQVSPPPTPNEDLLRDFTQAQGAEMMPPPPAELSGLPPMETNNTAGPSLDQTYADPAYAETDPTMAGVRIGGDTNPKLSLPKLTGRNLRIAALTTGVAVVGLVAAKGVFNTDDPLTKLPQQTVQQNVPQNNATVSIPTPDTSSAPIGEYADNKAVSVAPSSEAAKTLNSAAAAGDSIAQFQLGLSYLEQGRTDEGVALIRKSANQNQPAAQYRLAKLYDIGEGVSQDREMARQLTERAATNGNRIAMHDLALYYAEGRGGVDADLPTAAKWFEKAAERGVVDSQFNLGVLFESGQGLPKNMNDAFVWYSIAAEQGDQFAKTRVDVLKTTLDPTDLVSSAARVKKFKPRKINEAANGIFRNVAWGKSANNASNAKEAVSQVKDVQMMLTELGYDIGGADGSIGPKTRAAIMDFERVNSLPETGRVNTALADRLELATGA